MNQAVISKTAGKDLFNPTIVRIVELSFAVALSLAWIAYRFRFFLCAGGLWRDEVNSVDLAASPGFADIWHNLQYDSFPMLWFVILRLWAHSRFLATDFGLRLFGLLVGLGILAVVWGNARRFRLPTPIAALTLLGFTAAVVCFGDSIRGYGLGMLFELLAFGLIWDVATRPTRIRIALAFIVALAAVQMLFYNCMILAAVCGAGIAVAAIDRQWKRAVTIVVIGLISAASMTIYLPVIHRADSFRAMLVHPSSPGWLLSKFSEAVGYDRANQSSFYTGNDRMWEIAVSSAIAIGLIALIARRRSTDDDFTRQVLAYHLTALIIGLLAYFWFLTKLSYVMQPWYYLALLALVAVCVDGLLAAIKTPGVRIIICLAALRFCWVTAIPVWYDTGLRKTTVDRLANSVERDTQTGDLIVVSPWYCGITFRRYYDGSAQILTVPPVDFLAYHKYDLLLKPLGDPDAMSPVVSRAIDTLKSGHSVYLVGDFPDKSFDAMSPASPKHPITPQGWSDIQSYDIWNRQLLFALLPHARRASQNIPTNDASAYECPGGILVLHGWNDFQTP